MAQLAIKGHQTRGKEVIEILEMLGGKNTLDLAGYTQDLYYHINDDNIITHTSSLYKISNFKTFTVEEFFEKYPYKVGNKVRTIYGKIGIISKLIWSNRDDCVRYELEADTDSFYFISELQPYKEETMEEQKKDYEEWFQINYLEFENNDDTWADEVEVNLGKDYEIQTRGDKTFIVKKQPLYPKTYEECCEVVGAQSTRHWIYTIKDKLDYPHEIKIINYLDALRQLLICRDAYWKIIGEQMGLDKPWKPDWLDTNTQKYCIYYVGAEIKKQPMLEVHHFLAFPTKEMNDAFFENFKDLIEACKELL